MKRIDIGDLVIEVTRRCNIECMHCLRGDAENLDMKKLYIRKLLSQVSNINNITFTGGEPSLNTKIIDYTLDICRENNISVYGFYIATNGIDIKGDFAVSCLRWYSYCDGEESCNVEVSNDTYHTCEDYYKVGILEGLSFFKKKFGRDNYEYNSTLINEGRAVDNFTTIKENDVHKMEDKFDFKDTSIYLNCNGDIINGCDWSYDSQDNHILCKVGGLRRYYNSLK